MEEVQAAQAAALKSDLASADAMRQSKTPKSTLPLEPAPMVPGVPSITPTSAFNLAYNDYLNGKYDLAVTGFQRFIKDFPSTSLTPNAHYWLGESFSRKRITCGPCSRLNMWWANFPVTKRCRPPCSNSVCLRQKREIRHGPENI